MSGALYAGSGWTVETTVLENVNPRNPRGDGMIGRAQPDGDGAWLLVKRVGQVFWVRSVAEAQRIIGADYPSLRIVKEW